jgi:hypothetical protein
MQGASILQANIVKRLCYSCSVALALVLLSFCVLACSVASGCGASDVSSTCQSAVHPTVAPSPRATARLIVVPTATPTLAPSPTPTAGIAPSQASTSTPFSGLTDQQVVTNTVQHYEDLVVVEGAYQKAYNLLSADLQASESYDDFIQSPNYVLKKGCWITSAMHVSQRDSLTWDAGVELTQVSCVYSTPIAYFDWHFEVQKQNGLFVITSMGLYPTGSRNQ